MAFDIGLEKQNLDRYITYWEMKYSGCENHICDGCAMSCGCRVIESDIAIEQRINEVYLRFMRDKISSGSLLSQARQAFWANIQFCENFNEYFWMNAELFYGDAQYYAWRDYLINELGLNHTDDKDYSDYFKNLSVKYRTWSQDYTTKRITL